MTPEELKKELRAPTYGDIAFGPELPNELGHEEGQRMAWCTLFKKKKRVERRVSKKLYEKIEKLQNDGS